MYFTKQASYVSIVSRVAALMESQSRSRTMLNQGQTVDSLATKSLHFHSFIYSSSAEDKRVLKCGCKLVFNSNVM